MPTHSRVKQWARRGAWVLSAGLLAGISLSMAGCTSFSEWVQNGFKVGPNYHKPPAPLPEKWVDANNPRVRPGDPNLASWWDVFDDPVLATLIQRANTQNLTVRAAAFRILEAQAQRNIAAGNLLPQSQTFSAQFSRNMTSANRGSSFGGVGTLFGTGLTSANLTTTGGTAPGTGSTGTTGGTTGTGGTSSTTVSGANVTTTTTTGNSTVGGGTSRFFDNWAGSLNLAWELDFWGKFRREVASADATLDSSVENYDEAVVLLLSNVATFYVEYRTLQKRLDLARKNVAQQKPMVAKMEARFNAGTPNSLPDYQQLKSNLENTEALIPQLEAALRQANNQLCILLGIPVRDLGPELGDGTVPDPADPSQRVVRVPRPRQEAVVVGIPGQLLLRRPDVLAAEREAKSQSELIGVAEADFYPHISITGSIGLAANQFSKLFNTRSWTGNIGPSLSWNILNYGRILNNVRFNDAKFQELVANYQNTVLNANLEAENALISYLESLDRSKNLQNSAISAANVTDYLQKQFKAGFVGAADTGAFINRLFTAQNFQVTQQDAAAQAEGDIALNLILLYRAMGGGWQIRLPEGAQDGSCGVPVAAPVPELIAPPMLGPVSSWRDRRPVRPAGTPNILPAAFLGTPQQPRSASHGSYESYGPYESHESHGTPTVGVRDP